jgi:hypothetical protein
MNKFDKVIANLRESLRHATPDEDGQPSYCMVRKDELEALLECVIAVNRMDSAGYNRSIRQLEACADE